jgi:hypothetical protein
MAVQGNAPVNQRFTQTQQDFIISGKVLFIAAAIAGLVAIAIFCPPLAATAAGALAIGFFAVVLCAGAIMNGMVGMVGISINPDTDLIAANIFRCTDHNIRDCAYFLFAPIILPLTCFCCCTQV